MPGSLHLQINSLAFERKRPLPFLLGRVVFFYIIILSFKVCVFCKEFLSFINTHYTNSIILFHKKKNFSQQMKAFNMAMYFSASLLASLVMYSVYWARGNTFQLDVVPYIV